MLGVGITNALIWLRTFLNPAGTVETGQTQNPLVVSSAYATYMATSSNIRYQVLAGVLEERGIEVCFLLFCIHLLVQHALVVLCSH
jgi:Protein RETICULATA-related